MLPFKKNGKQWTLSILALGYEGDSTKPKKECYPSKEAARAEYDRVKSGLKAKGWFRVLVELIPPPKSDDPKEILLDKTDETCTKETL